MRGDRSRANFGFEYEFDQMRDMGLIRGAASTMPLLRPTAVPNPGGLRFATSAAGIRRWT